MKIWVDGVAGPRTRYWIGFSYRRRWGPYFSFEALALALHRRGWAQNRPILALVSLLRSGSFELQPTGFPTGPHRPEHRDTRPDRPCPAEPLLTPEVRDLLEALGPPTPPRSASEILHEALARFSGNWALADIELREAALKGLNCSEFFNTYPKCDRLELAGDFSWSDFTGAVFHSPEPFLTDKAVELTGWFIGADFRNSGFDRAELSGDFARAAFDGAQFHKCKLSGVFHRARLGVDLSTCDILPGARFQGADLRGAKGVFPCEKQLHSARVGAGDKIVIRTGSSVSVLGREYGLCRMAQWCRHIVAESTKDGTVLPRKNAASLGLLANHPSLSGVFSGEPMLYDVAGAGVIRLEGWRSPSSIDGAKRVVFYLKAPGVTLAKLRAKEYCVTLWGDFEGCRIENSEIEVLELFTGSFRGVDLTGANIGRLSIRLDRTDCAGIKLPPGLRNVKFFWWYRYDSFAFTAPAELAGKVIAAWQSRRACLDLARHILGRTTALGPTELQRILRAKARTFRGLLKSTRRPRGYLLIGASLLLRRNQLVGISSNE